MSTDRKIAWFGIGLALLGLIPIFRDANMQLRVAYCAAFLFLVAFFLYAAYRTSGPQISANLIKKKLIIDDQGGKLAHVEQKRTIRVNYGSIQDTWLPEITTDGRPDNFTVDGVAVTECDQIPRDSYVSLRKRLPEAIFSNHEITEVWNYDLHDSFPDKHEAFDHVVTRKNKDVELTVILPANRPCIRAYVHLLVGDDPVGQLDDPEVSTDKRTIEARFKSPKSGHTLRLSWDW
jgi:hypothetical protein